MEIGHVVDFIEEYNEIHESDGKAGAKSSATKRREATQADIDAFWG